MGEHMKKNLTFIFTDKMFEINNSQKEKNKSIKKPEAESRACRDRRISNRKTYWSFWSLHFYDSQSMTGLIPTDRGGGPWRWRAAGRCPARWWTAGWRPSLDSTGTSWRWCSDSSAASDCACLETPEQQQQRLPASVNPDLSSHHLRLNDVLISARQEVPRSPGRTRCLGRWWRRSHSSWPSRIPERWHSLSEKQSPLFTCTSSKTSVWKYVAKWKEEDRLSK